MLDSRLPIAAGTSQSANFHLMQGQSTLKFPLMGTVYRSSHEAAMPDTVKFQTLQDACQLAKPFYYCAKIDLQLLIALFLYIAMTTKQRVCNGILKVKINLRFVLTVGCRSAATKAHHIFIDCLRQFVGVCCAKVLEEL